MSTSKEYLVLLIFAIIVPHCVTHLPIGDLDVAFDPEQTIFYLFTRANFETPQVLILNNFSSVQNSDFTSYKRTKVIIPGWTNNVSSPVIQSIIPAYLYKEDFNVIVADWYGGSRATLYSQAMDYVPGVGRVIAKFLNFVSRVNGLRFDDVYIIGHGLGAHCAGFVGKYAQRIYQQTIPVIFALDPDEHLYNYASREQRLDKTDAWIVQVIHASIGAIGHILPLGNQDFYVNGGGPLQPSCLTDADFLCSHNLAFKVFAESLNTSTGFFGKKCSFNNLNNIFSLICLGSSDTLEMGGDPVSTRDEGVFNVPTNTQSPYARGDV